MSGTGRFFNWLARSIFGLALEVASVLALLVVILAALAGYHVHTATIIVAAAFITSITILQVNNRVQAKDDRGANLQVNLELANTVFHLIIFVVMVVNAITGILPFLGAVDLWWYWVVPTLHFVGYYGANETRLSLNQRQVTAVTGGSHNHGS
jgi:hypothetical protein